jgi:hypothetical protein
VCKLKVRRKDSEILYCAANGSDAETPDEFLRPIDKLGDRNGTLPWSQLKTAASGRRRGAIEGRGPEACDKRKRDSASQDPPTALAIALSTESGSRWRGRRLRAHTRSSPVNHRVQCLGRRESPPSCHRDASAIGSG